MYVRKQMFTKLYNNIILQITCYSVALVGLTIAVRKVRPVSGTGTSGRVLHGAVLNFSSVVLENRPIFRTISFKKSED